MSTNEPSVEDVVKRAQSNSSRTTFVLSWAQFTLFLLASAAFIAVTVATVHDGSSVSVHNTTSSSSSSPPLSSSPYSSSPRSSSSYSSSSQRSSSSLPSSSSAPFSSSSSSPPSSSSAPFSSSSSFPFSSSSSSFPFSSSSSSFPFSSSSLAMSSSSSSGPPIFGCASQPCLYGGTCTNVGTSGAFVCTCPQGFSGTRCQDEVYCPQYGIYSPWFGWDDIQTIQPDFVPGGGMVVQYLPNERDDNAGTNSTHTSLWMASGVSQGTPLLDFVSNGTQILFQLDLTTSVVRQGLILPTGTVLNHLVLSTTHPNILYVSAIEAISNSTSEPGLTTPLVMMIRIAKAEGDAQIRYPILDALLSGDDIENANANPHWPMATDAIICVGFDQLVDGTLALVVQDHGLTTRTVSYMYVLSGDDLTILSVTYLTPFSGDPMLPLVLSGYATYNSSLYYGRIPDVLYQQNEYPPSSPFGNLQVVEASHNATSVMVAMFVSPYNDVYVISFNLVQTSSRIDRLRFNYSVPTYANVSQPYGSLTPLGSSVRSGFLYVTPWRTVLVSHTDFPYLMLVACNCSGNETFRQTQCQTPCDPNPCLNNGTCTVNATSPRGFECNCTSPMDHIAPLCRAPCTPNLCLNNATCIANASSPLGFDCNCTSPRTQIAPLCRAPCLPNPCLSGTECIVNASAVDGFTCNCTSPFQFGPLCNMTACPLFNQTLIWNVGSLTDFSMLSHNLPLTTAFTTYQYSMDNNTLWFDTYDHSSTANRYRAVEVYDGTILVTYDQFSGVFQVAMPTILTISTENSANILLVSTCLNNTIQNDVCAQLSTSVPLLGGPQIGTEFDWCDTNNQVDFDDAIFDIVGASFLPLTDHVILTIQYRPGSWIPGPVCNCSTFDNCLIRAFTAEYDSQFNLIQSVRIPLVSNTSHVVQTEVVSIHGTSWLFLLHSSALFVYGNHVDLFFQDPATILALFDPTSYFNNFAFQILGFSFRTDESGDSVYLIQLPPELGGEKVIVLCGWNTTTFIVQIQIRQVVQQQSAHPHVFPMDLYTPNTTVAIRLAPWGDVFALQESAFNDPNIPGLLTPNFYIIRCGLSNPCVDNPCSMGQQCILALPDRICI